MYQLARNYRKYRYDAGGSVSQLQTGMGIAQGASGIVDGLFGTDEYGRKPMGVSIASGAVQGASMGMAAGPYGAAAGTLIGAGVGFFTNRSQKSRNDTLATGYRMQQYNQQSKRSQAAISQDSSLTYGHPYGSFYAMGGQMETSGGTVVRPEDKVQQTGARAKSHPLSQNYLTMVTQANGGSVAPLSDDSVAFQGPSHEQGGIELEGQGAEVEGGESMKGDFVFSDRLGFAKEHKRLASAIGRIQTKGVMTPERVNAIKRMQDREQTLALSQEYLKHILSGGALPDPTQQTNAA